MKMTKPFHSRPIRWVVLSLLVSCFLGLAQAAAADLPTGGAPFYFVQITDTHLGERDHLDRTRMLVDQINDLPFELACVVHTGDVFADNVADQGALEEGLAVLRRLKSPVHILPGNHDILEKDLENTLRIFTQRVGPLIHQGEYHGVVFIFAYTESLALGFEAKGYDPVKELEAALLRAAGKPVLLFHHRPAVDDYPEYAKLPGWSRPARNQLDRLLRHSNVRAVITGHFHRDELHWVETIPVFAAPPVAGYWGRQASFRLYEYRDGRVGYRTLYLRD